MAVAPFLFRRLPFQVTLPTAPQVSASDIQPLIPSKAGLLKNYYLFGSDNVNMEDTAKETRLRRLITVAVTTAGTGYTSVPTITPSVGDAVFVARLSSGGILDVTMTSPGTYNYTTAPTLTVTGGGGTGAALTATLKPAPTVSTNFIETVSGNGMAGVISQMPDGSEQTEMVVVRVLRTAGTPPKQIISGALSVVLTGGGAIFNEPDNGGYKANARGGPTSTFTLPAAATTGAWMFIASSFSATGQSRVDVIGNNGALTVINQATAAKIASSPARNVGLGNVYYNNNDWTAPVAVAAYGLAPYALSAASLQQVYDKARTDLAARSISVI